MIIRLEEILFTGWVQDGANDTACLKSGWRIGEKAGSLLQTNHHSQPRITRRECSLRIVLSKDNPGETEQEEVENGILRILMRGY